ncbi:hypothetical protein G3O06_07540 [Burkholderia sp. Ac-20345]|uniref:hypothetical protein n=1 Tax=Burkholderia sp. Ac-20345 TaxID=2703891 RepID=UPI00197C7176|nr:hypothetical protein [Burkholderia sp. Ac-20345]MBN3777403.1 hypothetical protein [Burkholderia sp. Ac-20345]
MHPYKKPRHTNSSRSQRRAHERHHNKLLAQAGKTTEQAAADVSRLHAEAHALTWYACECGHRERIWNSRDGVTPFAIPCPSCGAPTLYHANPSADESNANYEPHEGQRVFVDMTREQAERIVERHFARMGLTRGHAKFDEAVKQLLSHTTGSSPLVAVAGDVAYYAARGVTA